jgi:DNA-binding transcriptional regulator GbsR (MarR family)
MNYMKKQEVIRLQSLSKSVGKFIRYWGFRNIHGEIWAIVYLSKNPLSGIEIGNLLGVSKALVSPALKELIDEGLIKLTESENSKTKRYVAEEDIAKIIHGVLQRREVPMIEEISQNHAGLTEVAVSEENIDRLRLQQMGMMIQMAHLALGSLLATDDVWGSDSL